MPDRSCLVLDALCFFHGWLCGEGLTSPGVLPDEEALKSELEKIDVVVRKVQRSDLFPVNLAPLVATSAADWPKQELEDGLVWKLRRLDEEDRRLLRLSIELYREELDSLAMFFKPSVSSDDLRALNQVWNELGQTAELSSEEEWCQARRVQAGPSHEGSVLRET